MAAADFKWYVYELFEPDTEKVFYVGKGSGKRIDAHEAEAKSGASSHKCNKIRSVIDRCGKIGKRKVAFFNDEKYAYIHEADRIIDYGIDNLANKILCTTLASSNVSNQGTKGSKALSVIKMFADRFAFWFRFTDGGKFKVSINGRKTLSSVLTEQFYNELCPKIMMRAVSCEDSRDNFIKLMRKYRLEVSYVPA